MTQTNPPIALGPGNQPPIDSVEAQTDPLLHLHKMSTTAGLGSQDYVEVSVVAVVAVLFGLASVLAIVSMVLLVLPVVGVALSIIALRQINHSNGTLTGRWLAILGLVLSGLITLGIFTNQGVQQFRRQEDCKAIASLCEQYGQALDQRNYGAAYNLFDDQFKARVTVPEFNAELASVQQSPLSAPIDRVEWNGLAQFNSLDDGIEVAEAVMKVHYKGYDEGMGRLEVRFRKQSNGTWQIDNIPEQFQSSKKPAAH